MIEEKSVQCPYCGESIVVLIDCSSYEQRYIEDCQVCCRPIQFRVTVVDPEIGVDGISLTVATENELL